MLRALKYIFLAFVTFIGLASSIFAFNTNYADIYIYKVGTVQAGQTFTVTIHAEYSGTKDWTDCLFGLSCPKGLFIKVYWLGKVYRIGSQGTTTNPNTDYYFIYSFDGSRWSIDYSLTLTAPATPGKYALQLELWVDESVGRDDIVASNTFTIQVVAPSETEQKANEIKQASTSQQVQVPSQPEECKIVDYKLDVTPSVPTANNPTYATVSYHIYCPDTTKRPYVKVYIIGPNNNQLACVRKGDTETTCGWLFENNVYYKTPVDKWDSVMLQFTPPVPGSYKVILELKNSQFGPDPVLATITLGSITVQSSKIGNQTLPTVGIKYCTSGHPILISATWANSRYVLTNKINLGETAYATIVLKNPYTTCIMSGMLKVEFKKDVFGTDPTIDTKILDITLQPGEQKTIRVEFAPTKPGEYHFDVYWSFNGKNWYKYTKNDVVRTFFGNSGDYASDDLIVVTKEQEVQEVKKEPKKYIKVISYWFEVDGQNVTEVVDGTKFKACVAVQSSTDVTGKLTLQLKSHAGIKSLGLIGDLPPDPVKIQKTFTVSLPANKPITYCIEYTARQDSEIHNERYYIAVLWEGKEIYHSPKDSLIVLPKESKNPFIKDVTDKNYVLVLEHHWVDNKGTILDGSRVSPGIYYVIAKLQNAGDVFINGTILIKVVQEVDWNFDREFSTCTIPVNMGPQEIKTVKCSVNLPEGKYHYEIYFENKKLVGRGPTLYVRAWWNIFAWFSDVFHDTIVNPTTIAGTIVIIGIGIALFLFAPRILEQILLIKLLMASLK